jgi:hypothetical protein
MEEDEEEQEEQEKCAAEGGEEFRVQKEKKIHLILQASVAQRVPPSHSQDAVHGQPPCQQHGLRAGASSCQQQLR